MKHLTVILALLTALLLAACHRPSPGAKTAYVPSPQLVAIDTLMQSLPDSALTLLMDTTLQGPYYQLLLSEALYKNDYAQTNRAELLDAMAYFDSIGEPFLAARCHYMNGVGYYELDSVVPACQEYLKALEIIEEHFEEEELVGYKAKFMALTNTHLCGLCSDQYLSEQTIYFGKQSLVYYQKYAAEPWHKAWVLERIGEAYYSKAELGDSANWYFNKALDILPDTNNQTYRDIVTLKAYLSYNYENNHENAIQQLNHILNQADNEREFLSRCLIIGDFYYQEKIWDSARYYLEIVFNSTQDIDSKILSAQRLQDICQNTGDTLFLNKYTQYLSQQANTSAFKASLLSKISELYHEFVQNKNIIQQETRAKKWNLTIAILLFTVLITAVLLVLNKYRLLHVKKQKNAMENQLEIEKNVHLVKQAALSGRLRKSNERLRETSQQLENYLASSNTVSDIQTTIQETADYEALMKEGLCIQIKQKMKAVEKYSSFDVKSFKSLALTSKEKSNLVQIIDRHCPNFSKILLNKFPSLKTGDLTLCRLYLLDLTIIQVAILLGTDYSSIRKRTNKLKEITGFKELSLQLKSILFE